MYLHEESDLKTSIDTYNLCMFVICLTNVFVHDLRVATNYKSLVLFCYETIFNNLSWIEKFQTPLEMYQGWDASRTWKTQNTDDSMNK